MGLSVPVSREARRAPARPNGAALGGCGGLDGQGWGLIALERPEGANGQRRSDAGHAHQRVHRYRSSCLHNSGAQKANGDRVPKDNARRPLQPTAT